MPAEARRVAVLGVGGVGGIVAARTGAACVVSEDREAVLVSHGITVRHPGGELHARPPVVTVLEEPVSLLVVAVKAFALREALHRIRPEALEGSTVLPLLNGLEHVRMLREAPATSRALVVAGSIGRLEAYVDGPGVVVQRTGPPLLRVASDSLDAAALDLAVDPLRVPGLDVERGRSERAVLWEKAARLAVLSAASIASRLPVGALRADPTWRIRMEQGVVEACDVARAEGIVLVPAEQLAIIDAMPGTLTPSAARDAAAGRRTELDAITGSVVRAAHRLGVPAPALEELLADAEAVCRER